MSDERRVYPWLRLVVRLIRWALSVVEEKRDDQRRLSGTRVTVAVMVWVFASGVRFPLGWPDAFLGFCVLFALGIAKAIDKAPAQSVVDAVTGMFGKPATMGGGFFGHTTSAFGARAVDDPSVPMGSAQVEL